MRRSAFQTIFLLAVVSLGSSSLIGQGTSKEKENTAPTPPPCPQLSLNAPTGRIVRDGEQIIVSANIAGGDPNVSPTFVWTASAGTMVNGQGTRNLTLDFTGAGVDRQVNVELWVSGYSPECTVQTNSLIKVAPPATKVVELGELTSEKEAEQVKAFVSGLQVSTDNIYVMGYAGRSNVRGFTSTVLKRIKADLLADGLNYERLGFVDGGFREEAVFEFWIVPVGADAPHAKPTIAAKDIVFPKTIPVTKKP